MSRRLLIHLALAVVTLVTYAPVRTFDFVGYDDADYVTGNDVVRRGLTWEGVRWAFAAPRLSNYHPLTLISHMLDVELFGLDPGWHHVSNVLLHAGSAMLLFAALRRMTGRTWPSALAAALFAWHPLRVESVAWVAERKDVLSTFFWVATMYAYARYATTAAGRRRGGWYAAACALLAPGLLAKTMLVTLPAALLLLDVWPLRRARLPWDAGDGATDADALPLANATTTTSWSRLVVEKLPMLALCLAVAAIAYVAQSGGGAVGAADRFPLSQRVANAVVSYVAYLGKTVAPRDLAVFYPHPATLGRSIPVTHVVIAALILVAITSAVLALARRAPYLLVGWLWYLGTLVPVIGVVQIGRQSIADRYTYVPSIGLAIAVAWAVADVVGRLRVPAVVTGGVVAAVLVALLAGTRLQLRHWRDSAALWTRAAAVVPDNYVAHYNLGVAASAGGNLDLARQHYARAVEINGEYRPAQNNLGAVLEQLGDRAGAERHYRAAIAIQPAYADAHLNLGRVLVARGRAEEGIERLADAARLGHDPFDAYVLLAMAQRLAGRPDDAVASLQAAHALRSQNAAASAAVLDALAAAYAAAGRLDDAIATGESAIRRAREAGDAGLADAVARRVEGYRSGRPAGTMDATGATTAATTRATRPAR